MKLIAYEIYKILNNKIILLLIGLLFVMNIVVFNVYTDSYTNPNYESSHFNKQIQELFDLYEQNPNEAAELYGKVTAEHENINNLFNEAIRNFGDFDFSIYEAQYFKDLNIGEEMTVFKKFSEKINYVFDFKSELQNVIKKAENNLEQIDNSELKNKKFLINQQQKSIKIYESNKTIHLNVKNNTSAIEFLLYDFINIFILFTIIIFCAQCFSADNKNMSFMVLVAKKGRKNTVFAKIFAIIILNFATLLIYSVTLFVMCTYKYGGMNLTEPIQSVKEFMLCPFAITLIMAIIFMFLIKFLIISTFSIVILCVASFKNQIITYISGIFFVLLNFILTVIRYTQPDNIFRNWNLYNLMNGRYMFTGYKVVNLFGNAVYILPIILALYSVIIVISTIAIVSVYLSNKQININLFKNISLKKRAFKKNIKRNDYNNSLLSWEFYKNIFISKTFLIIIPLIIINFFIVSDKYVFVENYQNKEYKKIMTQINGTLNDTKKSRLEEENIQLMLILSQYEKNVKDFFEKRIDFKEYSEKMLEHAYATEKLKVISVVNERYQYLEFTKQDKNIDVHIVYDIGWQYLFNRDFNIIEFMCLVLLLISVFSHEFSSGFYNILHTAKNGRKTLFNNKYFYTFITLIINFIIFEATDIFVMIKNYGLPSLNAPLLSMPIFSEMPQNFTIMGYFIFVEACSLIGWIITVSAILALSNLLKNNISSLTVLSIPYLLPYFIKIFGYTEMYKLSPAMILKPNPLISESFEKNMFNFHYSYLVIFVLIYLIIVFMMNYFSKKRFNE